MFTELDTAEYDFQDLLQIHPLPLALPLADSPLPVTPPAMLNASLLAAALFVLAALTSGCHAHRPRSPRPLAEDNTHRRRSQMDDDDAARMESEIFGTNSDDSSSQEDDESSISLDEMLRGDREVAVEKRRGGKGPTLSVVNPLEVLRQRLMLDLARRKIHENQKQIAANAHFLENIGKRQHT